MLRTHSTLSLKLSAVALALAFQGAAFAAQSPAQTPPAQVAAADGACQPGSYKHHWMHGHRHGAAMLVPGYGPIGAKTLASLELNDSQSELLKSARAAGKDLRQARREDMKNAWKAKGQQLAYGKTDPPPAVATPPSPARGAA